MPNDKSGGATPKRSKQGTYLFEVHTDGDSKLSIAQQVRLSILISEAVKLALSTTTGVYCVPVYK